MERKKEDRSLLMVILLSLVTCGIYGIYFYYVMVNDLNEVSSSKDPETWKSPNYLLVMLLSVVTCGFYSFYWLYKVGNTIQKTGEDYGVRIEENGTTLLLWNILGSLICGIGAFVTLHFLIKNMNTICMCYNREFDGDWPEPLPDPSDIPNGSGGEEPRKYNDINNGTSIPTIGMIHGEIVCTRGSLNGAEITIQDNEVVTIGRDGTVCNLVLPDMDVSRRHCTVQFSAKDNCYYVTDYSSLGTRLNGIELLEKGVMTKCQKDSRILLGQGKNEFLLQ